LSHRTSSRESSSASSRRSPQDSGEGLVVFLAFLSHRDALEALERSLPIEASEGVYTCCFTTALF